MEAGILICKVLDFSVSKILSIQDSSTLKLESSRTLEFLDSGVGVHVHQCLYIFFIYI